MNYSLSFTPKSITNFLLKIILLLFVANVICRVLIRLGNRTAFGFIPIFNFDMEFNIPSWYSVLSILFCAFLLKYIAIVEKRKDEKQSVIHWKVLSYIFIYLGFDELMSLHEHMGSIARNLTGTVGNLNNSRYWIIPYSFLLILFSLFFYRFFLRLPNKTKISFFIAGFVFVFGAVGVELFGGQFIVAHPNANFLYAVISTLEELLEMIGIVLFIRALVSHIVNNNSEAYVSISLKAQPSEKGEKGKSQSICDNGIDPSLAENRCPKCGARIPTLTPTRTNRAAECVPASRRRPREWRADPRCDGMSCAAPAGSRASAR